MKSDINTITAYLDNLNPQNPLELVKVSGEVKLFCNALNLLTERINAQRQVKLWQDEVVSLQIQIKELSETIEKAKGLNEEYCLLEQHKSRLIAQKETIENLNTQKEEIEKITSFLKRYDLPALQKQLAGLKEESKEDIRLISGWASQITDLFGDLKSNVLGELQVLSNELRSNQNQLDDAFRNEDATIKLNIIEMSIRIESYDTQLQQSKKKYNQLATQLNSIKEKLAEIKDKHTTNITSYETHFAQNKAIWGALGEEHNLDSHLDQIIEETEKNLSQFDKEIKNILTKTDHLKVY
jgi:chromosome segregation ATPase